MAQQSFFKFIRPDEPASGPISDRDLDIIHAIARYRFCPASHLVLLCGGNEDVTHRRLRRLWERGLISRWAFPGIRTHSEFHYYLDNRHALDLLNERRGVEVPPQVLDEIKTNRERDYAGAAVHGQPMQLGFLKHSLMVSRLQFLLEMGCRKSGGQTILEAWVHGARLSGRKVEVPKLMANRGGNDYFWHESGTQTERVPIEPDAMFTLRLGDGRRCHFFYEADRGSMNMTAMLKKLRAYHHLIKKQQRHKEAFGIHPVRAVLIETASEKRAKRLMELVNHPLLYGPGKRAGLFWFTISPLFTGSVTAPGKSYNVPCYHVHPELILDQVWALPDRSLHALGDADNTAYALSS